MEKDLKFKTNINCGGCVAKVTPLLNAEKRIISWKVDTQSADKVLSVRASDIDASVVIDTVKKAGFTANLLA